ncbi:hypothetical protein BDP27DRAFT_102038 [Rhodocollybia butyracea]|uniref:Uncharacterized protein n=1 Tax=Rhodocollybia butyracea TaxID=206335 RepID=A0A9P5U3V8_9AGAR|nr:hypothetical protein BDP27DRAFT_102038 [Rhodocollybia butyracea]
MMICLNFLQLKFSVILLSCLVGYCSFSPLLHWASPPGFARTHYVLLRFQWAWPFGQSDTYLRGRQNYGGCIDFTIKRWSTPPRTRTPPKTYICTHSCQKSDYGHNTFIKRYQYYCCSGEYHAAKVCLAVVDCFKWLGSVTLLTPGRLDKTRIVKDFSADEVSSLVLIICSAVHFMTVSLRSQLCGFGQVSLADYSASRDSSGLVASMTPV